jgi:hypothetical protein
MVRWKAIGCLGRRAIQAVPKVEWASGEALLLAEDGVSSGGRGKAVGGAGGCW